MAHNETSEAATVDGDSLLAGHDFDSRHPRLRRSDTTALDGDGTMLGRVLIYAGIMIAAVAIVVWRRIT